VKFLADMGISLKTVAFLHALGHDALHLSEQGLERLPDRGIVEKARQERRIMLVHDLGFGELVAVFQGGCAPAGPALKWRLKILSVTSGMSLYKLRSTAEPRKNFIDFACVHAFSNLSRQKNLRIEL